MRIYTRPFAICLLGLATLLYISSCKKKSEDPAPTTEETTDPKLALRTDILSNYSAIAFASYEDAWLDAKSLETAIASFLSSPSETSFQEAKSAWKQARITYGQTEAFRGCDGPIDNSEGPEGYINGWPMDEAYLDYVLDSAQTDTLFVGIINYVDAFPTIDTTVVLNAAINAPGEKSIATGYHAIEFLLWGQDFFEDSPGRRASTDYTTQKNAVRRGKYLWAAAHQLVKDLAYVKGQWDPSASDNYRTQFLKKANINNNILYVIENMGLMSKDEFAGERINVALEGKDQEDEHSCFSDNTHIDIQMNAKGMQNVYLGSYVRKDGTLVKGKGMVDLVASVNPSLAKEASARIESAVQNSIQILPPFDQAIKSDPGGYIAGTIAGWEGFSDAIAKAVIELKK